MTELIWDGKYKDGKKVAPVRIPLPFQTIETVNESTEDRKKTIDLFASGKPTEWRNRLIWGDKKYIRPSLLPEKRKQELHFHSLRHMFATLLLQADVPIYTVNKLFGHASVMTTEIYSHVVPTDYQSKIERIEL